MTKVHLQGRYFPDVLEDMENKLVYYKTRIEDDIAELELEAVLAIEKIISIEKEFPGLVQARFLDHLDPLVDSARKGKYPLNNWLEPDGLKCDRMTNYNSIKNHFNEGFSGGPFAKDADSGRNPELHAACRLMMSHTRTSKGIIHELDHKMFNIGGEIICPTSNKLNG